MKMAKNPDYSNSAEPEICNPPSVGELLLLRRTMLTRAVKLREIIAAKASEETAALARCESDLALNDVDIRAAVEAAEGSYQDTEANLYAVRSRKESITYHPAKVRELFPKLAQAVIEETVDRKAFEGMVKGGLVTAEDARQCATIETSYAWIVRA